MINLAMLSLSSGWLLGQFFKVFVLVPAIGLVIPVVLIVSLSSGDTLFQTALKIAAAIWIMPVGYALGQMLLNIPCILRGWRKTMGERNTRPSAKRD